eukprot:COSAG02_NODE_205_length_29157_cov_13.424771_9_plen_59_part_00
MNSRSHVGVSSTLNSSTGVRISESGALVILRIEHSAQVGTVRVYHEYRIQNTEYRIHE